MSINALLDEFKGEGCDSQAAACRNIKPRARRSSAFCPTLPPKSWCMPPAWFPWESGAANTKTISRAKEYCATFYCTIAQLALEMLLDGTMDRPGRHHHADHLRHACVP